MESVGFGLPLRTGDHFEITGNQISRRELEAVASPAT